jgi:hypothetical protein
MGFFDALADGAIAVDHEGRLVFYPGWFASGFVVPSDAEYQRLRTGLVRANLITLAGLFLTMVAVPTLRPTWANLVFWVYATSLTAVLIVRAVWWRRVTSGWRRCAPRHRIFGGT